MKDDIRFSFEGHEYLVPYEAVEKGRIVLPDKTIIRPEMWLERMPPTPHGLKRDPHLPLGETPEETARLANGVVAKRAPKPRRRT
jgi:hypothetical protein